MSDEKFDLFKFLGKLNRRDMKAFDDLSVEDKKAVHPLVIMRWLSGTGDEAQIVRLNEFCNKYVFSLGEEKPLLFKLLAASCTGRSSRSQWLKGPGGKSSKLAAQVVSSKLNCSTRIAETYLPLLTADDILQYADEVGLGKDEIKKLTLELNKDGSGSPPKSRGRAKK